jgi:hypothetical protein
VFSKVALDQVCMAPLMTSIFFAAMTYLEGCRQVHAGVMTRLWCLMLVRRLERSLDVVVGLVIVSRPPFACCAQQCAGLVTSHATSQGP